MGAHRLLVVDDEPEIVRLITRIFESRGFSVDSSADGEAAIERAKRLPDLILLDLDLPKLDGWEVCRRLRADETTKHIPIVMMTAAHVSTEEADRGLRVGADEYIQKPFLREVLLHNVERLLGIAK